MIFVACVCYYITASLLGLIFSTSLHITIVELHPLSNRVWKFFNFALPFLVLIHPCRIGYEWLFIFLARLVGLIISCSKFYSDIFFTSLSYIYIYSISIFDLIWVFSFKRTLMSVKFFYSLFKNHFLHLIQLVFIVIIFQKFRCFLLSTYSFGFIQ